ncbi:MAG: MOSC domain-containing protein [Acidimicrobiia bacterium]|nr:MOSC domain-containing protein [Acidimicrobiia bacterium]
MSSKAGSLSGHLDAVCVVAQLHDDAGSVGTTAIDKRPITGAVRVHDLGVWGDIQADRANHGGTYQAVYAYATEDAEWWADELGRDLPPGSFGENLRISGMDVSGALVGERWRIGDVVLEATSPRIPCKTFARWLEQEGWLRRFNDARRHGAYLRVVNKGTIEAGQEVEIIHRPSHGTSIRLPLERDPEAALRLLEDLSVSDADPGPDMVATAQRLADRA